jgi:hypothetical protein
VTNVATSNGAAAARLRVYGAFAAACALPILVLHLVKASGLVFRVESIADNLKVLRLLDARSLDVGLISSEGTGPILWTVLWFALGGGALGAVARRAALGEVLLAAIATTFLQALLWCNDVGWDLALFRLDAMVGKDRVGLRSQAALLLVEISVVCILAAVSAALAGASIASRITGKRACPVCRAPFDAREDLEACPRCKAVLARDGIAWNWIAGGTLATLALFVVLLQLGGPLGFFHRCDPGEMSATCKEVKREVDLDLEKGRSPTWIVFGRLRRHDPAGDRFLDMLHPWKYLAIEALAFAPAPFFLALRVKKKGRPTAFLLALVGALAAAPVGIAIVGAKGGEGIAVMLVRVHVFAIIAWCLVGFVAAVLGHQRRYSSEQAFLDDLDPSTRSKPTDVG